MTTAYVAILPIVVFDINKRMIVLLGFPKTATTSFAALFEDLGLRTIHFSLGGEYVGDLIRRARDEGRPLLKHLEDANIEAVTKLCICMDDWYNVWPQLDYFKEMYEQYPDNIYILNRRDPHDLYRSFSAFGSMLHDFIRLNQQRFSKFSGGEEDKFVALVLEHYRAVQQYFMLHPEAKFVDFDIDCDDISKLNSFIDLKGKTLQKLNETPH